MLYSFQQKLSGYNCSIEFIGYNPRNLYYTLARLLKCSSRPLGATVYRCFLLSHSERAATVRSSTEFSKLSWVRPFLLECYISATIRACMAYFHYGIFEVLTETKQVSNAVQSVAVAHE
jgi:hypothetical protein